jgi:hypothetical protein
MCVRVWRVGDRQRTVYIQRRQCGGVWERGEGDAALVPQVAMKSEAHGCSRVWPTVGASVKGREPVEWRGACRADVNAAGELRMLSLAHHPVHQRRTIEERKASVQSPWV